jgi:predicted nucleic acid-binding protein
VIVLDASVVLEILLDLPDAPRLAQRLARDRSWHVPALLDLEVIQVIRRFAAQGRVARQRAAVAVADLLDLPVRRYPHLPLLPRIWALRAHLTAYDAAYVALAEFLGASLLTRDARLGRARGHRARVEVI